MASTFPEDDVHEHIHSVGLPAVMTDHEPAAPGEPSLPSDVPTEDHGIPFELWRVIRARAVERIHRLHGLVRHGEIVGSKLKLKTDSTRPMELDFLGIHEDGLFVLELKVDRAAERNAFSELFGYSNFIAGMFAASGRKDVTNVLVAPLLNKITAQAYLYDLLINDRDTVVYRPEYEGGLLTDLRLRLFVPDDEVFRAFANHLLSHDAMSCVVLSFHNVDGWIESAEAPGGDPPRHTLDSLAEISGHAAQLMEAEGLHGFCFARKPWKEVETFFENSLIVCALNPFTFSDADRALAILAQIAPQHRDHLVETARIGFDGRLADVAQRALRDALGCIVGSELEFPAWSAMVTSMNEVVYTHNLAFRPTGLMREAYASYIESVYARNDEVEARAGTAEEREEDYIVDVPTLQIDFLHNWLRAWQFMTMCGLTNEEAADDCEEQDETNLARDSASE